MVTEEILTVLEKQFVGWNRDGPRGILFYLNQAQNILCTIPAEQFMIINELTGKLPSFDTTEDDFAYNLPSTVNFVDAIMVEADAHTTLIDNIWAQDYGRTSRTARRATEQIDISGIKYIEMPYVRTFPWTESAVAKVVFTEKPGESTDTYRYRGYKRPTDLVSDSIPLSIQPPYDMTILMPATAKLMEGVQNNNYVDAFLYIQKELVPEMHKAFNIGAFGIDYNAEDRGF